MERYVCIHGHFYQPPRENPWLEAIELQDSAYPFHDWNARVTAECYRPNGASRILDGDGFITEIVNNYSKISFNFGPTVLAWMASEAKSAYQAILDADRESRDRFNGHGSAIAQAYNHIIMPLANSRDKRTQVVWGIRDFQLRFGRDPEGMWLPETAVDLETLDILAEHGIRFTILSPYQANRIREIGDEDWVDASGGKIDPTRPYICNLASGRSIVLFFYDGPISQAVAFEHLLSNGERFANRLVGGFNGDRDWPQLMHIATDGETYGHHHRHGDMALAYALKYIEDDGLATLTNYGAYLDHVAPTHEVEIYENTSWSCVHGVERWRSNCGCNSGGHPDWNQEWRAPLRDALDWLRDTLSGAYELEASKLLRDPWAARDAYIDIILDRSDASADRFLEAQAKRRRRLQPRERIRAFKLLEMQRHLLLMYTSCGWFFDELSGIETVQVIQYAGRAVQLAQELFANSIEEQFLQRLELAKSNLPEHGDGRRIWGKFVKPAVIDLPKVGAHYAISSVFEDYPSSTSIYCYEATVEDYHRSQAGRASTAVGRAHFRSIITGDAEDLSFGVLHFGDHNLTAGVRPFRGDEQYELMVQDVLETFERADFAGVIRAMDAHFEHLAYSLGSLFRDEQRKILRIILRETILDAESSYRHVYEDNAPLLRFLGGLGAPIPDPLRTAAAITIGSDLREAFDDDTSRVEHIRELLDQSQILRLDLDAQGLAYTLRGTLDKLARRYQEAPGDLQILTRFTELAQIASELPFEVNVWSPQNVCYAIRESVYPEMKSAAEAGDETAAAWVEQFVALADALRVRIA